MKEFKLLAIEPRNLCLPEFHRILKVDTIYSFYRGYEIRREGITETKNKTPSNFYSQNNGRLVSICAIVGRNGSGKSTLLELLYAAVYNVAVVSRILKDTIDDLGRDVKLEEGLHVSVYFLADDTFFRLDCLGKNLELHEQAFGEVFKRKYDSESIVTGDLSWLFYTVAINYSFYGLNSKHSPWLEPLFHKNDGYQTPIVLNPYRNHGILDVNNEEDLTIARVASNVLTSFALDNESQNELAPGKKATAFLFQLHTSKGNLKQLPRPIADVLSKNRDEIIELVIATFNLIHAKSELENMDSDLSDSAKDYIVKKLYSISRRYRPFKLKQFQFIKEFARSGAETTTIEYRYVRDAAKALIERLRDHPSHITTKFSQAINFIDSYSQYRELIYDRQDSIPIREIYNAMKVQSEARSTEIIEVLPPPFFQIDIKFDNGESLRSLSSGEQQKIYSSATWIYHLVNLSSVVADAELKYHRFEHINLVFDEIELYYHPELQRTFVADFLSQVERLSISPKISINCIFITHSPFILSDIPNQNILFIDRETDDQGNKTGSAVSIESDFKTFGANIHEHLIRAFFMNGTIGKIAEKKVHDIVAFYNDLLSRRFDKADMRLLQESYQAKKEQFHFTADNIGEPYISNTLRNHILKIEEILNTEEYKEREIAELLNRIDELTKRI